MNELALFAGAGGGLLASKLLGWTTVGAVEIERYCRKVILRRQREGHLDKFPIWDDIQTFDGKPWKGVVDIITGGFPCQDISQAGKGAGIRSGKRSGLWSEFARIINEVQPSFAFIENVPKLVTRGLDIVLSDLANMGYHARWCRLGAGHIGYIHKRERLWILAYSNNNDSKGRENGRFRRPGTSISSESENASDYKKERRKRHGETKCASEAGSQEESNTRLDEKVVFNRADNATGRRISASKPLLRGRNHGVANWVDRIAAIGNGQVPEVAALAFTLLSQGLI